LWPAPPGRDLPARLQPGMVIPGITPKKNTTMVNYEILKIHPKKLGQAADEIFRVAACPL
jgi:hypothetical protein